MPNDIIGERSTAPQNIVGILRNVGSGRGIASIDLDSGCHLVVTYTDGTTWTSDETLRGITSTAVTDEYKLKLTYEDGTTWESTQSIRGPVGPSTDTKVGELEDLTTVEKGTAVGAINELDAKGKKAADSAYQLLSKKTTEDTDPYLFRRTPEGVGDRADDTIVGGTVAWNQLVDYESRETKTVNGVTITNNNDGTFTLNGTATADIRYVVSATFGANTLVGHKIFISGCPIGGSESTYSLLVSYIGDKKDIGFGTIWQVPSTEYTGNIVIYVKNNTVCDNVVFKPQCVDLTQLFGTEIADYIYSLEQETAGAGVAWFKQYFPAEYYPYNAGELVSVKPTAKVTRGFNQWDEEWENSYWRNGEKAPIATNICSSNKIRIIPNSQYYIRCSVNVSFYYTFYDINKNFLTVSGYDNLGRLQIITNNTINIPNDAYYIAFTIGSSYGTVYNNDICINLSDPSKNGTYEPYVGRTYPLGAEVRGLISLSDDKLTFNNGDIYTPDGKVKRKYGIVDLGTCDWRYLDIEGHRRFIFNLAPVNYAPPTSRKANAMCDRYEVFTNGEVFINEKIGIAIHSDGTQILVYDPTYTDAATFKTAMSGVHLVYELASPTTEQSLPYDSPQVIFPEGTEQYVDDRTVALPVGHITTYHTDMRNKLESLPDSTVEHWETGSADQLTTKLGDTELSPYLFRKSGGDLTVGTREYDTLVGGTVAWNQVWRNGGTATTNGITFTIDSEGYITITGTATNIAYYNYNSATLSEHVYYVTTNASGDKSNDIFIYNDGYGVTTQNKNAVIGKSNATNYLYLRVNNGTVIDDSYITRPQAFDLTQMLGTTIADYVYSLETATAGSGIAWLKKYGFIDGKYHPYDAGSLLSVHPSTHKMIGFNQWDEEWELGGIGASNGVPYPTPNAIRAKNFSACLPNTTYYFKGSFAVYWYDNSQAFIKVDYAGNNTKVSPENARYFKIGCYDSYGTTYKNDICINLSKTTGSPKNGDYVPYTEHSYALPDADLRGIFKLDSNNVPYCDGDTDDGSGTRTRKYGIVDMGTLNWIDDGGNVKRWRLTSDIGAKITLDKSSLAGLICAKYPTGYQNQFTDTTKDKYISGLNWGMGVTVVDSSYTDVAAFTTAMSGVYLVFELATPTTESSTPFQNPQIVDPDGTEEYIDTRDVTVPVGHSTFYPKDLKRKLEELPDPPSGANGTYILKATINNGTVTYTWVTE